MEVSNLSPDILYEIFMHNANIADDKVDSYKTSGLYAAKAASQVCHEWRLLLLDNSLVWASILNIPFMCRGKPEWGEEVLRRTRAASLCVKAEMCVGIGVQDQAPANLLSRILSKELQRIQNLDLAIGSDFGGQVEIFRLLNEPAPTLQSLRLVFVGGPVHKDQPLFGETAPLLHFIVCRGFTFKTPSASFGSVRRLILGKPPMKVAVTHFDLLSDTVPMYTVSAILDVLRSMPILEKFSITAEISNDASLTSLKDNRVSLPFLRTIHISIYDPYAKALCLLQHLRIPYGTCRTQLVLSGHKFGPQWESVDKVITSIIRDASQKIMPGTLTISFNNTTFVVKFKADGPGLDPTFTLVFNVANYAEFAYFLSVLLSELADTPIANVKTFRTTLGGWSFARIFGNDIIRLIERFEAVEEFETDLVFLPGHFASPMSLPTPFLPRLRRLMWNSHGITSYIDEEGLGDRQRIISKFLEARLSVGYPQITEICWDNNTQWPKVFGDIASLKICQDIRVAEMPAEPIVT